MRVDVGASSWSEVAVWGKERVKGHVRVSFPILGERHLSFRSVPQRMDAELFSCGRGYKA
jgi:hypothetical protein